MTKILQPGKVSYQTRKSKLKTDLIQETLITLLPCMFWYCYWFCCIIDYVIVPVMPVLDPEAFWNASQISALPICWMNNAALNSSMS